MFIYLVVGNEVEPELFYSLEELTKKYELIGLVNEPWLRVELIGQPKLNDLIGPMYDGMKDGKHVIRYETQKVYDMLSN